MPTLLLGGALGYINVSNSGKEVFGRYSNLTSLCTLFGWGIINLSHIRFRMAWKLQGRDPADLPWKSWTWAWAAWFGLIMCILLIIVPLYLAVWPLGRDPDVETFFANYVSVLLILVLYVGAKIYYRGRRWVDLSTMDLDYGRRFYVDHTDKEAGPPKQGIAGAAQKTLGFIFN